MGAKASKSKVAKKVHVSYDKWILVDAPDEESAPPDRTDGSGGWVVLMLIALVVGGLILHKLPDKSDQPSDQSNTPAELPVSSSR